jgi:GT2 family glycosyltransferase
MVMGDVAEPALAVLVATRNRAGLLTGLLRSLAAAQRGIQADIQILVIDNGSTDETDAALAEWSAEGRGRERLYVEQPGKSRALNRALRVTRGALLAFTDDDVEVAPTWISNILDFFAQHPEYDAAMGRVRIPPHVDPDIVERVRCYETLPLFDRGDAVCDVSEMYSCNMVVRRPVIDTVGMFDERLGPGASGFGDDTDYCDRAVHAGLRIGYMPDAIVYHAVDVTRLTPAFFREYHLRKARGDFVWARERFARQNLSRLIDASLRWAWCGLSGDERRRMRARMRMIRHAEFLRLRWRSRRGSRIDCGAMTRP